MFHLLILAIIETLYIDIQIFVYLNDGKSFDTFSSYSFTLSCLFEISI